MKRFYFWIRILLSVGLIIFLFYTANIRSISDRVTDLNLKYIVLAYALGVIDRILMAYKWNILLRAKEIWISLKDITITYLSASFLGLFMPATVGADAIRAYAVAKEDYSTSDVVSSIFMERLLGMIALMMFVLGSVVLSFFVLSQEFVSSIQNVFWVVLAGTVALGGLLWISMNKVLLHRVADFFQRWEGRGPERALKKARSFYSSYATYRENVRDIISFFMLSCFENLFPIFWSFCVSLSFSIDLPLLYFFIVVPIAVMLRRIPISIGGIGVHEGTYVYVLSLIGISTSEALLLGITTHILSVAIILPGAIFFAFGGFHVKDITPVENARSPINLK